MFQIPVPWLEEQYINRISFQLDKFERKSETLYNCRCPICFDSAKRRDIARGYFIRESDGWRYYCHNCGINLSFYPFLKLVNPGLLDQFRLDKFKESGFTKPKRETKKELTAADIPKSILKRESTTEFLPIDGLINMTEMKKDHPAYEYILKRKIPYKQIPRLYYVKKFFDWRSRITLTENKSKIDHPRLVIPYRNFDNAVFRYSSRSFGKIEPRYIQTILDKNQSRIFGLELLDASKLVYIVEGQLDSLFLPNCVAVGSANYNVEILNTLQHKIYVPDNQPRNPSVVKQIKSVVESGQPICLWKENYGKDINQMVLDHNLTQTDLINLIKESTVSGIQARLVFSKWSKI